MKNNVQHIVSSSKSSENIRFEYTWVFCKGVLEEIEDDVTFRVYLKTLFRSNLTFLNKKNRKKAVVFAHDKNALKDKKYSESP